MSKVWLLLLLSLFSLPLLAQPDNALQSNLVIPDSLAKWYKPENKRQVWLHTMFGLRRELQAVQQYSASGDLDGVKKWSGKLLKHFRKLPVMAPEWKDRIDLETAARLEAVVARGDMKQARLISRELSKNCRQCHKRFQLLTRLRYRSADFSAIKIDDNGKPVRFSRYKNRMIHSLNRIKIAASDQHWRQASDALSTLRQQLQTFGQICVRCHKGKEPRLRILGDESRRDFTRLEQGLQQHDLKLAGQSLGAAAVHVCARCHGIHRSLSEIRRQLFNRQTAK